MEQMIAGAISSETRRSAVDLSDAELRMIQSLILLDNFRMLGDTTSVEATLRVISVEITVLEDLAQSEPELIDRLENLLMEWMAFRRSIKNRLH